jgi:hypothetical protein
MPLRLCIFMFVRSIDCSTSKQYLQRVSILSLGLSDLIDQQAEMPSAKRIDQRAVPEDACGWP